jgi:RNA polymerase sigma-70 factor, ECF subfamily
MGNFAAATAPRDAEDARSRAESWPEFERMVREHHRDLRAFAYRLVGDESGADEALQEAYLKAFRAYRRGSHRLTERWLARIVYTSAIDLLRERRRRPPIENAGDGSEYAVAADDDAVVASLRVRSALKELPEQDRALILLVDVHDFDYKSASTIIGVPIGTIASRLHAARKRLRTLLAQGLEDSDAP